MIELIIEPGKEILTFQKFCKQYGKNAIALDGFVKAPPQRSFKDRCINWNHHDGVSRADTYATCAQALTGIREQALLMFKDGGETNVKVYVNDCDEDVCLSWLIIKDHYLYNFAFHPLLNRLVEIENRLDASLGVYPYGIDMPMLKKIAWIFEDYRTFLNNGGKSRANPAEYKNVIDAVGVRINDYLLGKSGELRVDSSYELVKDFKVGAYRISQIIQHGSLAKMAAYVDGVHIGLSIKPNPNGNKNVTIWCSTPYMPCDTIKLSKRFNQIEKPATGSWGGGDGVSASPRVIGTALPEEVIWQELIKNIRSQLK